MLKREQIRRYLVALLCAEGVPQGYDENGDCDRGPIWMNCDGLPAEVLDHESHQIAVDVEGSVDVQDKNAALSIRFNRVKYNALSTRIDNAEFDIQIDIIAFERDGHRRANICDTIEERILFRLFSLQDFIDADTGEPLVSFVRTLDENSFEMESTDDQSFDGDYTIREIALSFKARECVKKTECDDEVLCFDFKNLTRLDKDA